MKFMEGDTVRLKNQSDFGGAWTGDMTAVKVYHDGVSAVHPNERRGFFRNCHVEFVHPLDKRIDYSKPIGMLLSTDPAERKSTPITTGVLDYFPLALAEVAKCSKAGNDQHNPGQPLHWAKEKSTDHADCIARHLIDRGTVDSDGILHSAKLAWRALANLQIELEAARAVRRAD